MVTKGNMSLMKEMQEKDDKINQLSFACQELQVPQILHGLWKFILDVILLRIFDYFLFSSTKNEVELMGSATRSRQAITHGESELKIHEITQSHDNLQQQDHTDTVRKQLQSLLEKEKMYKNEISDLKQQLSRRYFCDRRKVRKQNV